MEEQNNQNLENNVPEENEEIQTTTTNVKKSIPKTAIIITSVAIAGIALALILIFVVFKHEHTWTKQTCTEGVYCTECGEIQLLHGYGHSFGEWENVVKGDCVSIDAVERRVCNNWQITEEKTIPASHDYKDGICSKCKKLMLENINLRDDFWLYDATYYKQRDLRIQSAEITKIKTTDTDGKYNITIKYWGYQRNSIKFTIGSDKVLLQYLLKDSAGNIVFVGEGWSPYVELEDVHYWTYSFDANIDPNETYTLYVGKA